MICNTKRIIIAVLLLIALISVGRANSPTTQQSPTVLYPLGLGKDDSNSISSAIKIVQSTNGTLYLSPGIFTIDSSIEVDGAAITIQGSGPSTIFRKLHNINDYWDALFSSQNGIAKISFEDLTVDGSQTPATAPLLLNAWGICPNVDVGRVIFYEATAPYARQVTNLPNENVHDCQFDRSSAMVMSGQTYTHDTWTDSPTRTNECIVSGSNINLSYLEFIGTDRGIDFQGATNVTASWLRFIDIAGDNDAGECLNVENNGGNGLSNSNISYVTAIGCDSVVLECAGVTPTGATGMTNNTFTHINQHGEGRGILLAGIATGNSFSDIELEFGGVVWLYATAQNNSFDGLAIVSPVYSQQNQRVYLPETPWMPPTQAIIGATGNKFTSNVLIQGLPSGWISGLTN